MSLESFRIQPLRLDHIDAHIPDRLIAHEMDSAGRILRVQLTDGGDVRDTTGTSLSLAWKHQRGASGLEPFSLVDAATGVYEVTYPNAMMLDGVATCSIQVAEGSSVAATRNFHVRIQDALIDGDTTASTETWTALQLILTQGQTAVTALEEQHTEQATAHSSQMQQQASDWQAQTTGQASAHDTQMQQQASDWQAQTTGQASAHDTQMQQQASDWQAQTTGQASAHDTQMQQQASDWQAQTTGQASAHDTQMQQQASEFSTAQSTREIEFTDALTDYQAQVDAAAASATEVYIGTETPPENAVLWIDTTDGGKRVKSLVDGVWVEADAGTLGGLSQEAFWHDGNVTYHGDASNGAIRYPNGVQIAWLDITADIAIPIEYGSAFINSRAWAFAAQFSSTPAVSCGRFQYGSSASWGTVVHDSNRDEKATVMLRCIDLIKRSDPAPTKISAIAVGRWK